MRPALKYVLPVVLGLCALAAWEGLVHAYQMPAYLLPSPSAVTAALTENFSSLMQSWGNTLTITLQAAMIAIIAGVLLGVLFSQSRIAEFAIYPYAVILQVTPVFAIAPQVIIWTGYDHVERAQLILASTVAFFPILTNVALGLRATDKNLLDLFRLYGASRWQTLIKLQARTALPYFLSALKVAGGLALVGTIVAEFVAGSGEATGLGWRIVESSNRLEIPREFAALALVILTGLFIFWVTSLLEWLFLRRWHESQMPHRD